MKIVLASESFGLNVSGVAIATKNLARKLADRGHEVFVFSPGKVSDIKKKQMEKISWFRLRSAPNPFRSGYRITYPFNAKAGRKIAEINPDIIHLQDPAGIGRLMLAISQKQDIPVIATNHFSLRFALSYAIIRPLHPLLKKILTDYLVKFYNSCDQIITPTETSRKEVISLGVKTPIAAVSNGIDPRPFRKEPPAEKLEKTRRKFGLPGKPLVLYCGRIDKDKSIDVLIKSIGPTVKEAGVHFALMGGGDMARRMERFAGVLRVDHRVTFCGPVAYMSEDFLNLYKLAKIFFIPSEIETQSLVTLEALASGLPVVAARGGALPEIVHHGKNGFLFKGGDSEQAARYLLRILSSASLQNRFSRHSLKVALSHDQQKAVSRVENIYKKLLKRRADLCHASRVEPAR